ncbi:hypothetical protein B0H13DRAFT_2333723 [Mycena leptocephala]|nr:hypothetical protein B0H13DRAFT_2333723 [Mycena leptocephala]
MSRLSRSFTTQEGGVHAVSDDDEEEDDTHRHIKIRHPKLNGLPCDRHGTYLAPGSAPPPLSQFDGQPPESFAPFESRADFDFAHFHFVQLQSSAGEINTALDLWAAQVLQYGDSPPWRTAQELYDTIDSIQHGDAPWKVYQIRYTGPQPPVPPKWMTETYELCARDSRTVLHQQLKNPDFADKIDYAPYGNSTDKISRADVSTHGATFVPIVAGSDKTIVSVATGHQEYHPVYQSPGVLTGVARRAHGNGVLPVAFLPIPKTTKKHRKSPTYQRFVRQLYHACLAQVFEPLKQGMTTPEVINALTATSAEPSMASGRTSQITPSRCDAKPHHLDTPGARRRTHEKTDFLITCFDPGTLWDEFGIRADVVPFTHGFPRADIHELLSPDLLHQVIKGTFKDHLVEWVNQYLHTTYGESRALEIIADIDHRIAAVPSFPGLRRFPDGRDFTQWTGDDSKALMKVYIAAIAGHVPPQMVKSQGALTRFHHHRDIFIQTGVRVDISLPGSILSSTMYPPSIFSAPQRTLFLDHRVEAYQSCQGAMASFQSVQSTHPDAAHNMPTRQACGAQEHIQKQGMMAGTALSYAEMSMRGERPEAPGPDAEADDEDDDGGDVPGPRSLSSVELAVTHERNYPRRLEPLATYIQQPTFPTLFRRFLYSQLHPDSENDEDIPLELCPNFLGRIYVHHSAIARFYAPSDLCGVGGMSRERIRSHPNWHGLYPRRDTVFIETDADLPGMQGMSHSCALVHWYCLHGDAVDPDTGMWVVTPEMQAGRKSLAIVTLDCIARAAHLLPVYGSALLPEDFHFSYSLDAFRAFFVNKYVDHHTHEFLHSLFTV